MNNINPRPRVSLAALFLCAAVLACTLGQTPPAPAAIETTAPPAPIITDSATPAGPPEPAAGSVDAFFARCPTADEIALVNKDLSMSFEYPLASERLFHVEPSGAVVNEPDPTAGQLVCTAAAGSADLTGIQKRAYQSVLVMRLMKFSQPLPWTNLQLYDWFVGTIDGIRFRDDVEFSHCCDPTSIINIQVRENSYLAITDRFLDPNFNGGLVFTTVLYVHEARHNEGLGHTCPDGASDNTVAEMGAWAVQYYLQSWLAQYADRAFIQAPGLDPNIYRQVLLDEANSVRNGRFCEEPPLDPLPTLIP